MGKRLKWWMVVVAVAGAIEVGVAVSWFWFPGRALDPVAWQDEAQIWQGVRLKMADRMVARSTLVGKSRAEVVALLGEPTPTAKFADWDLVYWLGPERGWFGIDSEWLVLRLGPDGRVADNRIVHD